MPSITLPPRLRIAIYLVTLFGTPVVAYLKARGFIGDLEVILWSAEVTAAGTIAVLNVNTKQ